MTIYMAIPPLVMLIGLLVYVLASNPKASELGRITFAFGLLVTLFMIANGHPLRL